MQKHTNIAVTVREGIVFLCSETLEVVRLNDRRLAALWEGLAFPLGDGAIDIAGEAFLLGSCTRLTALPPVLSGRDDIVWWMEPDGVLLVQGDVEARDRIIGRLLGAGARVKTSGRYLADASADWFIRAEGLDQDEIGAVLEPIAAGAIKVPTTEELLAGAFERETILRAAVAEWRGRAETAAQQANEVAGVLKEAEAARQAEAQLRAAVDAVRAEPPPLPPIGKAPPTSSRKLGQEVVEMVAVLLPKITLVGGSRDVLALGLRDRVPILGVLRELHDDTGQALLRFKAFRGAAGWRERHFSTGQDDTGRMAYCNGRREH